MFTVTNLPPGVQIYVDVMAFKGAITGQPLTIFLTPEGVENVAINSTAYLVKEKRTAVQLSWSPPTDERYKGKELEYCVYYNEAFNTKVLSECFFFQYRLYTQFLHDIESEMRCEEELESH